MSINKEQDFGTPASTASQLVTLEIDGFQGYRPCRNFHHACGSKYRYRHTQIVCNR